MIWLFRKWCEWSHVHSWTTTRLESSKPNEFYMLCKKCRRIWRPNADEMLEPKYFYNDEVRRQAGWIMVGCIVTLVAVFATGLWRS